MTVHNPAGAIAIQIFLGTNLLMAADELDALVFGMAVESVRALTVPFTEKVSEIANRSHGVLLFNLRIDGDMELQRVAAIRYPSDQTGVLVLGQARLVDQPLHGQWHFLQLYRSLGGLEHPSATDAGQDEYRRPGLPVHRRFTQCRVPPAW
ncbi:MULTISPECIES: hypothetical protein [unclassified Mesorhizobium]|uniref:hypothetical protein n=1 Tax=unclassified Mesorhizobium TaxID=325217 RepID=UPI003339F48B